MRVFYSSGLVDGPYDRLYVRTIPLPGCLDRRFRYKHKNYNMISDLKICEGFPCFGPYISPWTAYIFPCIKKGLTFDNLFD